VVGLAVPGCLGAVGADHGPGVVAPVGVSVVEGGGVVGGSERFGVDVEAVGGSASRLGWGGAGEVDGRCKNGGDRLEEATEWKGLDLHGSDGCMDGLWLSIWSCAYYLLEEDLL